MADRDLDFSGDDFHTEMRKVQSTFFHPEFKDDTSAYFDVAVVKMDRQVEFNDYIRPICLPARSQSNPNVHEGKFVTLTGNQMHL